MTLSSSKIIIAFVAIALGAGAVIILSQSSHDEAVPAVPISPETVHTKAWYVAHPDIAKEDEARCGNNAASISEAACQNDASAENQLLEIELGNAAAENSAAAKIQKSQ